MNIVFNVFLVLHIVGGTVGLLTGMVTMLRRKGDKNHKLTGKVFYVSMLMTGISSLVLSCLHPNYFLCMVGVFTLYMVITGQRYLKHKQQKHNETKRVEWTITMLMLLAGLLFVGIGILTIIKSNLIGLVFIAFGSIGLLFVRQDFKNYTNQTTIKQYWLVGHLQRMTGSFIAALTAFLVVNDLPHQIPGFVYWLLPTVILTPLIIKWSNKYGATTKQQK